ncbi:transcription antitermination factor NusB [Oscillospiraceae bacterium LCP25S3_E10]|nr:transcription antitermination factor NusB [Ruminococcus sp.]MDD6447796.1 transcription antitermination factor NusB [Ruminococcus sp.]MDY2855561.1 transcription antitermination factor NusB [Oscillospiraceae bacterium]
MKSKLSRRQSREQAFLLAFERNINHETFKDLYEMAIESRDFEIDDFAMGLLENIENNENEINELIQANSKNRTLNRISKVALSIMQLAISELKYADVSKTKAENPESVIINEAVIIAKKYSTPEETSFINGILGAVVRGQA